MKLKLQKNNEWIELAPNHFAGGGEGNLYHIVAPSQWTNYVAKIYHPHKLTATREEKISFLTKNPPSLHTLNEDRHPSIVWVKDALYNTQNEFLGFVMPMVKGEKLEILCTPKIPKKLRQKWQRFDFKSKKKPLNNRLRLAFNIATAVQQVHENEKYVLVDMKPDNIIIQTNGLVSIVDTDSIEVIENGVSIFEAPVATPEYSPPEYYQHLDYDPTQKQEWDCFGLAVILYKLLFGIHPFAASTNPPFDHLVSLDDKIKAGLFVHNPSLNNAFKIIPPPHAAFHQLDPSLQDLFIKSFVEGHQNPTLRPTAEEWCATLLFALDDEKALQRYGHILGLNSRLRISKHHFALPSQKFSPPTTVSKHSKMIDFSQNLILPKKQIRRLQEYEYYNFTAQKISSKKLLFAFLGFIVLGSLGGLFAPIILLGIFLFVFYQKENMSLQKKRALQEFKLVQYAFLTRKSQLEKQHRSFRKSIGKVLPFFVRIHNKIEANIKHFKDFMKQQDQEVKQLQKEANSYYDYLQQKYLKLALQNRYISRLGSLEQYKSINKIKLDIQKEYKNAIKRISKGKIVLENNPDFETAKISVDNLVKSSRIKIDDWVKEELQTIKKQPLVYSNTALQKLKEAADIEKNQTKIWLKRWFISNNEKTKILANLKKIGLHSILQIEKISLSTKTFQLKDGQIISFRDSFGNNKTSIQNVWHWFDEIKHQKTAYLQLKKKDNKNLTLQIEQLEDKKRIEISKLKELERKELEKVKLAVQKVVLGEPFQQVQKQYETMTSYVEELEVARKEEQKSVGSSFENAYEAIMSRSQQKQVELNQVLESLKLELKQVDAKLKKPAIQKKYAETVLRLEKLTNLLSQLEGKEIEYQRFEKIKFSNYIKNKLGIK